ncbi:GreA/GreB family elongation factor [Aestuariibaculum sp. M13]|uniref:GreA/GreB family elongation factor n=1 Tax=Aestuariibaculum sp. M13 TaxID=2967132 RepID=UPI00215A01C0|nr:GreA/GreB family elongation factor [Aestuariibaculum sp. M13]MCR8668739.1 GreA/GreB family elongation factor [Aestuariibaculum sp. M13]
MKYGNLILEKKEYVQVKHLLNLSGFTEDVETKKSFVKFIEELKTAHVLDEEDMPQDIVRLNSIVTVASYHNWEKTIQIVQPAEKDLKANKISILTPMGAALFGYAEDDQVVWNFPTGPKELKILNVIQNAANSSLNITQQ